MTAIDTIRTQDWQAIFSDDEKSLAIGGLESGNVVLLPELAFSLADNEEFILRDPILSPKRKNISYNSLTQQLGGVADDYCNNDTLKAFMARYAKAAQQLVCALLPRYCDSLEIGRTSYRPAEIAGRASSPRKDDTRLHVDAFPSSPVAGKRILRVFCNINPWHQPRVWHLGESFRQVADRFMPLISRPMSLQTGLMKLLHITKGKRTPYDHYMLHIHDKMKCDETYQENVGKQRAEFLPGSTWMVYTDLVSHAALSGSHLLEQTFYVPVSAMQNEALTPLRQLEAMCHRPLV
ncbi:MAG: 3-deoxy-D-manno-oct-2-ulosonic acid (Kdo) hydroxylase [Legionellales bacterium]|nr:3-deoxy-D-manno-oct-2-ulosonic acid (Kdo) hydroxylase [Legionellales bacterium]|tara:strand:- start:19873 stop:20751 length:879 start_codon:yes stop_codon:yes gene_type:complete